MIKHPLMKGNKCYTDNYFKILKDRHYCPSLTDNKTKPTKFGSLLMPHELEFYLGLNEP